MPSPKGLMGISFPYEKGALSFPQQNNGSKVLLDAVKSMLLIGEGEVPLGANLGTTLHSFTFQTINPFTKAAIVQEIRKQIEIKAPKMAVISVEVETEGDAGTGYALVAHIVYELAGEIGELPIPLNPVAPKPVMPEPIF